MLHFISAFQQIAFMLYYHQLCIFTWIADELYQDAGIDLMIDNLFIMLYFATSLSILVPRSHRPDRLIAFDFKRIIFTLSVEWSN